MLLKSMNYTHIKERPEAYKVSKTYSLGDIDFFFSQTNFQEYRGYLYQEVNCPCEVQLSVRGATLKTKSIDPYKFYNNPTTGNCLFE